MNQVIFGGYADALNSGATEYNCVSGGYIWTGTLANRGQLVTTSGKIKSLYVELSAAPGAGAGDGYDFYLMVNGVESALHCHIVQPATSGSDLVNEVDVAAGDSIVIEAKAISTPSATPTAQWSMMFSGTTANESLLLGETAAVNTGTVYGKFNISTGSTSTTEADVYQVIPTDGTIKNLYIGLSADPGTSPDAYRFTLRKNGASTTLTCTITANAVTGNNVANSVAVVAGDYIDIMVEPLDSPSETNIFVYLGATFVSTIDGESLILGGLSDDLSNSAVEYSSIDPGHPSVSVWTATEANVQTLGQVCTLKKLYVRLSGNPYNNDHSADTYTFTVRNNAATPANSLVALVTSDATTANDTTNSVVVAAGDNLALMCTPASTPTVRDAYWGLVCYIATGWTHIAKINGVASSGIAKVNGVAVASISKVNGVAV
jgi:hypothetical protein